MTIISLVAICCLILPLATQQGVEVRRHEARRWTSEYPPLVACEGELAIATLQVNHLEAERLDQVEVEQVGGWCWQVVGDQHGEGSALAGEHVLGVSIPIAVTGCEGVVAVVVFFHFHCWFVVEISGFNVTKLLQPRLFRFKWINWILTLLVLSTVTKTN